MLSKHFQKHFIRIICIAGIFSGLLSACLAQAPTDEPITMTATADNGGPPTSTPSPSVPGLQVANWRISSFTCDKNGTVENVTVEVTAEGGTLPYTHTTEGVVESNPPATKYVPPADTPTTAAPVKKPKNVTATPTDTPIPPTTTLAPLLPGQFLVNVQTGVEKITIRSADGQSVILEVVIPSLCSELSIMQTAAADTPAGTLSLTSSPQPSATATMTSSVNNLPPRPVCSDGLDNDGDGYVDLHDRNCKSKGDQDESH